MRYDIFKNKNVLVTGATGGLGQEIVSILADNGCNLFLTSLNEHKLKILKNKLSNNINCGSVFTHAGDLKKVDDIIDICFKAKTMLSDRIDILINCAGIFPLKKLSETTLADYDECMAINVKAPFLFVREFVSGMRENKWGRIVNIGSSSAYSGSPDAGLYCISKHALLGLSRSLFQELKEDNIRVYSYSPGSIRTEMGRTDKRQDFSTFLDPKEVAEYVLFIMSYDAELVSEEIRVNRIQVR
tara:strand:+ start:139 stop:867 length:729 start_codon:yes stop_codon:yes gene_type:complete